MKTHIKTLTLASLALAYCLTPFSSAQAHDLKKWERNYAKHHHSRHYHDNHHHVKNCRNKHHCVKHHAQKHHARYHRKKQHAQRAYKKHIQHHKKTEREHNAYKKSRHKKVIVHKHAPTKVVYVHKDRNDDYRDKILAVMIAQAALLLTLD